MVPRRSPPSAWPLQALTGAVGFDVAVPEEPLPDPLLPDEPLLLPDELLLLSVLLVDDDESEVVDESEDVDGESEPPEPASPEVEVPDDAPVADVEDPERLSVL